MTYKQATPAARPASVLAAPGRSAVVSAGLHTAAAAAGVPGIARPAGLGMFRPHLAVSSAVQALAGECLSTRGCCMRRLVMGTCASQALEPLWPHVVSASGAPVHLCSCLLKQCVHQRCIAAPGMVSSSACRCPGPASALMAAQACTCRMPAWPCVHQHRSPTWGCLCTPAMLLSCSSSSR